MDAPPPQEDVRPFVRIGRHLIALGLSAPRDPWPRTTEHGFLLLEDLGDDTYRPRAGGGRRRGRTLRPRDRRAGASLHGPATAALLPGLGAYAGDALIEAAMLLPEWYLPAATGTADAAGGDRALSSPPGANASPRCPPAPDTLLLRDYHKDNLLWLPARPGVKACGLLDFQDAQRGHPSYDLVSLIEDARRDVPPAVHAACLERYIG